MIVFGVAVGVAVGVAIGGAVGAVLRWRLAVLNRARPIGTLAANLSGCFLLGLVLQVVTDPVLAAALATGLLGGLTTFSTFAVELATGEPAVSRTYVVVSLLGGIVLVLAGSLSGSLLADAF